MSTKEYTLDYIVRKNHRYEREWIEYANDSVPLIIQHCSLKSYFTDVNGILTLKFRE